MSEDLANDFRSWFKEPEFRAEQRRPIYFNAKQQQLVTTRTDSGYRRVKGPAGSGKSIVLAARAATLMMEGKRVLVVCYNITLINYLRDLCSRCTKGMPRCDVVNKIIWLNFHTWCKRVCREAGAQTEYTQFWKNVREQMTEPEVPEVVFDLKLADMVGKVLDEREGLFQRYDAVLVDEGQDFLPEWWGALRKVCKPRGEMLLLADASQDIYNKSRNWTDQLMTGAGFVGAWSRLEASYRLPTMFLPYLRDFARRFLPQDLADPPEVTQETFLGDLEDPCHLRWIQVNNIDLPRIFSKESFGLAASKKLFL